MPAIIRLPNSLRKIDVLILDFDGTIINPPPINWDEMKKTVHLFLKRHGIELKRKSSLLVDITTALLNACQSKEDFLRLRRQVYEIIAKFEMEVLKYEITPTENIHYFLQKAKKMSLKLAIFSSNSKKFIMEVLKRLKLDSYFDEIVSRDDLLWAKPKPEGIYKICEKLRTKPERCVVIGDLTYDVIAAKEAGAIPIGVLTGHGKKEDLIKAGAIYVFPRAQDVLSVLSPLETLS